MSRYRQVLTASIHVGALITLSLSTARASEFGVLEGVALDAESSQWLDYVNVMLVGPNGWIAETMTQDSGRFRFEDVPAGRYRLTALYLGRRRLDVDGIVVSADSTVVHTLLLDGLWPSREIPLRSVVGTLAAATPEDFHCYILPMRDVYRVGDLPEFTFGIEYRGSEGTRLVACVDGSAAGRRFPKVIVELTDPQGKVYEAYRGWCANLNQLRVKDFVPLKPGGSFNVHGPLVFLPSALRGVIFTHAGEYTMRFRYTTDAIDYALWTGGFSGPVPNEIMALLTSVPRIELDCSITVDVVE